MHVEGDGYEQLNDAIQGGSFTYRPRSSKADAVEYYKETYGEKNWRAHLQHDFGLHTTTKLNSYRRQFDPSRLENKPKAGSENERAFRELGKKLPLKKTPKDITGKRARITAVIWIEVSNDPPRRKELDARNTKLLSAKATNELKQGSFNPMIDAYGVNPGDVVSLEVESISIDFL